MTSREVAMGVVLAAALTGCAAVDLGERTAAGVTADAMPMGARAGPVVGAVALSEVGGYMDAQARELTHALAAMQPSALLQVVRVPDHTLKIMIAGDLGFDFNSAQLRPEALAALDKIATVLLSYGSTVAHVVCHTDASGSDPYNQDLSQRRAAAIAAHLGSRGLPGTRVRSQGRGEREPIANNNTADGRKRNRRIDIVIKPVIEGREQQAWAPPSRLGV